MQSRGKSLQLAQMALCIALAMILSYVERLLPLPFGVPGMKLGLSNLVVMIALYYLGPKQAFGINVVRILLVGFTFGSLFSMLYALAGGILSFAVMVLLFQNKKIHPITISAVGGIFHNVGQILVAMMVLRTAALGYYLAVLWISGIVSGSLIGLLGGLVLARLPRRDIENTL